MALFSDKDWFDAQLKAAGLAREQLARALSLTPAQIEEVWKDQREISAHEVATIAAVLGVSPQDVAHYAGVSTPVPRAADAPGQSLGGVVQRLDRIERTLAELKVLVLELRRDRP